MKKFYTIISLQQDLDDERSAYCYQAVGNPTLQLDHKTRAHVHRPDDGGAVCLSGEEADHHLLHRLWPDPAPGAGQEHLDGPGV